ncbi:MAG: hypothetical protein AAB699_00795 [Patescibacteria group bacterium]
MREVGLQNIMILEKFLSVLSSPIFVTVLTLLNFFQWYGSHAKEQTIKHNLFAMRRVLVGINQKGASPGEIASVIEMVDATLATLGTRRPYISAVQKLIIQVHEQNLRDARSAV